MRALFAFAFLAALASSACDGKTEQPVPPPAQTTAPAPPKVEPKFEVKKFHRDVIPADLQTLPQPVAGLYFVDARGENLVVLSQDPTTQESRFQHVLVADARVAQTVQAHDVLRGDCEFDFSASFEVGALGVTDLDGDDIGEVTVMFKHACRSDVSPQSAELWMLEGDQRRILRGGEILILPGLEPIGDGKATAEGFDDAPKLAEHAREIWKKHVTTQVRSMERESPQPKR